MPIIREADLLLDFHQTIQPCAQSFFIFGFDEATYDWARILAGPSVLVTRKRGTVFAVGYRSIDEYGIGLGIPSTTVELGQKGFSDEAYKQCLFMLEKAAEELNALGAPDRQKLKQRAERAKPLKLYGLASVERFENPSYRLRPGLINFQRVDKGEVLGWKDAATELRAPADGFLLFPKYPERDPQGQALRPLPVDLYVLLKEGEIRDFSGPA